MTRCTETAEPRISILMAVYEPRMDWLREQLASLEAQSYPNLKLYVRDDCSTRVSFDEICACFAATIRSFPYEIARNEKNLGSNLTFERLTREAEGEYFAYCDQDDVWLPEKLSVLREQIEKTGAGLVCSDVIPIDADGRQIGGSITELRPRHVFAEGRGLTSVLIYRNFVIGCTMLIRSRNAKAALPFAKSMVHDHFLAYSCAVHDAIAVCPQHLVRYRLHGNNQTGVLAHISSKKDYFEHHLLPFCFRVEELNERYPGSVPEEAVRWAEARKEIAAGRRGARRKALGMWRINRSTCLFEFVALALPDPLFRQAVRLIQKKNL